MYWISRFVKKIIVLFILVYPLSLYAQTDNEFWFVVPEITISHNHATTPAGGRPSYFRFATDTLPARVTISQPANPSFVPIVVDIPLNSSWNVDMSNYIATQVAGVWTDNNILENKPPTFPTEKNTKGLYIKSEIPGIPNSKSPITAYYEINNLNNGEIWALKGKNALGKDFYVPFQQLTDNGNYAPVQPYSAIDIVASENGTTVLVTPTNDAEYCIGGTFIPANTTKSFLLNKGETITIYPKGFNQTAAKRLSGTHVTSDKPIAISLKDDSISHTSGGGCKDAIGDQLIPVNIAGLDYICNRTFLDTQDNIIVLATQNGTNIYVDDNPVPVNPVPLNAGQQIVVPLKQTAPNFWVKISSRPNSSSPIVQPIIVYHIGGFGCEVGAAIVPPINVCTGSTNVSFTRSNNTPFYLTMMVRDGAQDGFLLDGAVQTDLKLIRPSDFILVPGTSWRVARFGISPAGIPDAGANSITVGQHKITNTKNVFHLGIVNGTQNTTCWFGYFSDFNVFNPPAFVVETGASGGKLCYGSTVQLYSSGGTNYKWTPDDFLSNTNIKNPLASNITKSIKYNVAISGACNLTANRTINIIVASNVIPQFTTDIFAGCAPLTVNITNSSIGSGHNYWDLNSDGDFIDPNEGENNSLTFPIVFDNTTTDTVRQKITLVAWDATKICSKSVSKTILIYPKVTAQFTIPANPTNPNNCHPLSVTMNNSSTLNGSSYSWSFDDGGSSYLIAPTHIYNNFNLTAHTYTAKLVVTDKYNYCKDSTTKTVQVQPYIKASFTVNQIEGCSPFTVNVLDDSKGGFNQSYWDRNGDGLDDNSSSGSWSDTYTNPTSTNIPWSIPIRLTVKNAGGCSDVITRTIISNPSPKINTFTTNNHGNALGCSPLNIDFAATTNNATIYHWLIDGNAFDNTLSRSYTFENFTASPTIPPKVVTFTASNTFGCSATQTTNITVQPYVNAEFVADKEVGCSPLNVGFINASSLGSSSFQWYIDGSPFASTANIPIQLFSNPAINNTIRTIPIRLIANNTAGCTDDITKNITVNPQSTVSFTYTDAANLNHCSPFATNFTSSVTNTETYQWEFGSFGASTLASPPFTFSNDGVADVTVPVSLKTNNSFGCLATTLQNIIVRPSVKALFSLDKTAGCPPYDATVAATNSGAITNYTWNFNGSLFTGANQVFHNPTNLTGLDVTKKIKLTVSSGFCSDTTSKKIVVYPQVHALYTALPLVNGCSPLTVNFVNQSALYGTGTTINNILWDFKDNTSSIAPSISHTFINTDNTIPKPFNVKLTATTTNGCVDDTTIAVTVNPTVTAAFNAQIVKSCTPMQIRVVNASFAGPSISTYTWNFDGGTPVIPPNNTDFLIDYANITESPINKTISLNLSNSYGCSSIATPQTFTIDPQVLADVNIALPLTGVGLPIDKLCAPAKFTFNNNSKGGSFLTYTWDFKDGVIQTVNNRDTIGHIFANRTALTKQFDVKLTAVNVKGCKDDSIQKVYVYPEVDAKFSMTRDSSCTPFYIRLKDESLNGTQWSWDFGAGAPSITSTTPGETFTQLIDNVAPNTVQNYKINLKLDDLVTGCKDTISQRLEVYPKVISDFSLSPISGCSPTTITFTNNSTGLGNYLWELDNGLSFNLPVPTPLGISNASTVNEKTIKVKLTATNALSCKSVSSKTVTIAPKVIASYTASILDGCDPFTANFSNLTPSTAYNYSWKLNGVEFATTQDYANAFTNPSNPPVINKYSVQLQSTYKLNVACKDTVSKVITVYPRVYPNFTFTNAADCHPLVTNINNSTLSYNNSAAYTWNLGNGTYSTLANLTNQIYKNNSAIKDTTYSIKLIARSEHQCVDSISKSITVHPRPIASYVMNNESVSCSPFPIELHNHSTGTDLNYFFDLDDGPIINTIDKNKVITHTYHNLTNDNKDYIITLTATTAFGCSNSTSQTIYAYPEVTAKFSLNPNNAACSPFTVGFNNTTNNGYFYQWSFDDGTNSNLMSPSHRFVNITENDKVFDVHLKAISAYDCTDDTTISVTVYATPVANFSVNPPLKIYPDATFNFHNQSNPAADGWSYFWTFGDGYTSSVKEAGDHTYTTWGQRTNDYIYTATLKIDAPHCSSITSNVLRLLPTEPIPFFSSDIYKSCSPLEIHLINASQYGNKYLWDFGDGTTSTEEEPIHVFTEPGYYVVKLRVSGDGGDSFYYKTFRVFQNPIASFAVYPNRVMLPGAEVHVYNLSKYADRYEWDLGDGTLTTDKDPVHSYNQLGEYKISLRAFAPDTLGSCQDFTSVFPAVWVEGEGLIKFPDAFMPSKTGSNGGVYDDIDYKNEVFHPIHYGVVEFKLMVFNRWGEQVFQSNDVKVGWDGYFQGKLCDQGVYVWRAIGKYTNGKAFDRKGNVTLLR